MVRTLSWSGTGADARFSGDKSHFSQTDSPSSRVSCGRSRPAHFQGPSSYPGTARLRILHSVSQMSSRGRVIDPRNAMLSRYNPRVNQILSNGVFNRSDGSFLTSSCNPPSFEKSINWTVVPNPEQAFDLTPRINAQDRGNSRHSIPCDAKRRVQQHDGGYSIHCVTIPPTGGRHCGSGQTRTTSSAPSGRCSDLVRTVLSKTSEVIQV